LADHLAATASAVMGLPAGQVLDSQAGFFQLGMDSLMSVTLQRRLAAGLGIGLPAALIYEYPTVSALTDALLERMGYPPADHAPAAARSGLGARAQQRARLRQGSQVSRRKGHVV
jgi:phthiocerol/phenolphthiocerol synthesis type-I polyketide synthase B